MDKIRTVLIEPFEVQSIEPLSSGWKQRDRESLLEIAMYSCMDV